MPPCRMCESSSTFTMQIWLGAILTHSCCCSSCSHVHRFTGVREGLATVIARDLCAHLSSHLAESIMELQRDESSFETVVQLVKVLRGLYDFLLGKLGKESVPATCPPNHSLMRCPSQNRNALSHLQLRGPVQRLAVCLSHQPLPTHARTCAVHHQGRQGLTRCILVPPSVVL
jgi:hypothetical protein